MTDRSAVSAGTSAAPPYDRVVLVHGFGATTRSHWFDWLGANVRVELPDPDAPRADEWIPLVRAAIGSLDARTAVVAHSLGGITAARAIGDLARVDGGRLGALVAVAPFAESLPRSGYGDLDAFVDHELARFIEGFDPDAVREAVRSITVIRSDDDPLVPPATSDAFAAALAAPVVLVPGAGHFLAEDGVTQLEPVLTALRSTP